MTIAAPQAWRPKANKFRNVPTEVDGVTFQSKREARRWCELRLMQKAGYITDLQRQVAFRLDVNGQHIAKYIADFTYQRNGLLVCEDSKGVRTPEYKLKAKLMLACHQIQVVEV